MITAQVVLINSDGLALGVSRKDNHNDFGLAGGKMEPIDDNDPIATAIRECKEETGLDATNLRLIFAIHKSGNMGFTYLADYTGEIKHDEPHTVKWVPFEVLINGSFGRYNKMVSESLTDIGIKYQLAIDKSGLDTELINYIKSTVRKGYKLPFIFEGLTKNHSSWGADYLVMLWDSEGNSLEEEWNDHDYDYENALKDIGLKYHTNIGLPSHYYTK